MSDEADLSTEQPRAGAPAWLSRADGDAGRPHGDSRPPQSRPQEAVGLGPALPDVPVAGLETLTRRADFLAANAGRRAPMPGFVLLVRERADADPAMRIGYTVTRKIGNAVVRNRMKRRLRALARALLPEAGVRGADHVLIGRQGGIERDFALLRAELARALRKLNPSC